MRREENAPNVGLGMQSVKGANKSGRSGLELGVKTQVGGKMY